MANAFSKLKTIFGPPRILGIDIGTTSIKAVELSEESGVVKLKTYGILENYGHLERINDAIQTSSLKIMDEMTAEMMKQLLREMKPTTRTAVMSIPVFSGFVTLMELPQMSDKEVSQAVPYEARQYIPIPLTEVALDWVNLGPAPGQEGGRLQVLLIAVPQDIIAKYQRIADLAGLKLKALEIEALALARAVVGIETETLALLDIGARATTISIVDEGYVRMTRGIDTAGGDLTQVIASGMGIAPRRAEEVKKERGISIIPGQEETASLLIPLIDVIVLETKKFIQLYAERSKREVKKIVLAGGTALLPGLGEYISKETEKETIVGNAFSQVRYDPMLEPIVREMNPVLAVCIGLALREFSS